MIHYAPKRPWSFLRWHGSVAPHALKWALPCAALAVLYHRALQDGGPLQGVVLLEEPSKSETTAWTLFTYILGFLLVFRAQLAYARYWEGITLVERGCAVWLNGVSNLVAFCTPDPEREAEVEEFQYLLSRLMSLLQSFAMSRISRRPQSDFPSLDLEGIDQESLDYLAETNAKQYVALQWIQRLVVENKRTGIVDVEAPILSRVFQEFSIGIVHFVDADKLSSVPFPFPFAQALWVVLAFFSAFVVPFICASGTDVYRAATYTFMIVFMFWGVHHVSVEIELPFGSDPNDLPLPVLNRQFNKRLERLMDMKAQQLPTLQMKPRVSVKYIKKQSTRNLMRSASHVSHFHEDVEDEPALVRRAARRMSHSLGGLRGAVWASGGLQGVGDVSASLSAGSKVVMPPGLELPDATDSHSVEEDVSGLPTPDAVDWERDVSAASSGAFENEALRESPHGAPRQHATPDSPAWRRVPARFPAADAQPAASTSPRRSSPRRQTPAANLVGRAAAKSGSSTSAKKFATLASKSRSSHRLEAHEDDEDIDAEQEHRGGGYSFPIFSGRRRPSLGAASASSEVTGDGSDDEPASPLPAPSRWRTRRTPSPMRSREERARADGGGAGAPGHASV